MPVYGSDFFIKNAKLIDLYDAIKTYITTNFPNAIITVNQKSVSIAYCNEEARINIFQNKDQNTLYLQFTRDLTSPLTKSSGTMVSCSDLEGFGQHKSAIKVVLDMYIPNSKEGCVNNTSSSEKPIAKKEKFFQKSPVETPCKEIPKKEVKKVQLTAKAPSSNKKDIHPVNRWR